MTEENSRISHYKVNVDISDQDEGSASQLHNNTYQAENMNIEIAL